VKFATLPIEKADPGVEVAMPKRLFEVIANVGVVVVA
jgi:hypothetical protein